MLDSYDNYWAGEDLTGSVAGGVCSAPRFRSALAPATTHDAQSAQKPIAHPLRCSRSGLAIGGCDRRDSGSPKLAERSVVTALGRVDAGTRCHLDRGRTGQPAS
jgi:hypothetical protein